MDRKSYPFTHRDIFIIPPVLPSAASLLLFVSLIGHCSSTSLSPIDTLDRVSAFWIEIRFADLQGTYESISVIMRPVDGCLPVFLESELPSDSLLSSLFSRLAVCFIRPTVARV